MKIKIDALKCERCGKIWVPRTSDTRQCPKCKSAYWDKPRDVGGKSNCGSTRQ